MTNNAAFQERLAAYMRDVSSYASSGPGWAELGSTEQLRTLAHHMRAAIDRLPVATRQDLREQYVYPLEEQLRSAA